nr:MAG TPA: hypothetical protein [Caudoviricetes sp.]
MLAFLSFSTRWNCKTGFVVPELKLQSSMNRPRDFI